ncbi:MAG: right-handed parallel beta-helix repeat-containing protein, partial [Thermoguttaceae bacterium]
MKRNATLCPVAGLPARSLAWCLPVLASLALCSIAAAEELYVNPAGSDANPGTRAKPFATIAHARDVVRELPQRANEPFRVVLRGGVYRLSETLVFTAADSGAANAPVEYCSADGETAVISGAQVIAGLKWVTCTNGILQAKVPAGLVTDQLFVNGEQMPMARYPNFDRSQRIFKGVAADAFSDERAARWQNPAGGFMHAMHKSHWGGMHYQITGKDTNGKPTYEGGWQNNRPSEPHDNDRFVENIFEELDAPGEWFFNARTATLFFYPPSGLDLAKAAFESVRLKHLVEFRGTEKQPVRFVAFSGLSFRHAARTFMENKEPILRTDWTVYRGGAVFLTGTEDCRITDCVIDHVGGNALFVNNYNRGLLVRGCHIFQAGGNGIAFVGDPAAVRNGLVGYSSRAHFADIDKTPGPMTPNYPADSRVEDCLIHEIGRVEKQV